jgi:hypothetical protein
LNSATALSTKPWQSGTARLLPRLIGDRRRGPLFLPDGHPATADLCRSASAGNSVTMETQPVGDEGSVAVQGVLA